MSKSIPVREKTMKTILDIKEEDRTYDDCISKLIMTHLILSKDSREILNSLDSMEERAVFLTGLISKRMEGYSEELDKEMEPYLKTVTVTNINILAVQIQAAILKDKNLSELEPLIKFTLMEMNEGNLNKLSYESLLNDVFTMGREFKLHGIV